MLNKHGILLQLTSQLWDGSSPDFLGPRSQWCCSGNCGVFAEVGNPRWWTSDRELKCNTNISLRFFSSRYFETQQMLYFFIWAVVFAQMTKTRKPILLSHWNRSFRFGRTVFCSIGFLDSEKQMLRPNRCKPKVIWNLVCRHFISMIVVCSVYCGLIATLKLLSQQVTNKRWLW